MRRIIGMAAALALAACMQKQANGTYRVPHNSNAAKAGAEVKKATDEIANSQAIKKLQSGLGKAAVKAGEKLQEAGVKAQNSAAKHH
jgi:hypothetical protein